MHVVNQRDGYWWQARRDGEEDTALPGLIPSAHFLQTREAMKNSLAVDVGGGGGAGADGHKRGWSNTGSGFLCAKRSGRHGKNKRKSGGPGGRHTLGGRVGNGGVGGVNGYGDMIDEPDASDEVITYEEVIKMNLVAYPYLEVSCIIPFLH